MIYNVSLDDLLIFTEDIVTVAKIGTLDDTFSFSDSIDSHRFSASFNDRLQYSDSIAAGGGAIFVRLLSDTLTLTNEVVEGRFNAIFSDFLILLDWFVGPEFRQLHDTLTFVESMSGWSGPALLDAVTLVDSLNYKAVLKHPITDSLTFRDGMTGYVNDPWRPIYPIVEETP